jgi:hypothetical protein
MKFKEDIGIAIILRNKKIDKNIKDIFIKSYKENLKFFPKKLSKFNIFICDNEEEYKKYARPYYTKWSVAVGLGEEGITTRSPEFIDKIGQFKIKDFQNIMNHEISHIFWFRLCHTWSPQWFIEGLACYIGNNFPLKNYELKAIIPKDKITSQILDYRYLRRNFEKGRFPRYQIWQSFFTYIINKYHKDSIKRFILAFSKNPTKKNYNMCFKEIFGKSDRVLFSEYLNSLTKMSLS